MVEQIKQGANALGSIIFCLTKKQLGRILKIWDYFGYILFFTVFCQVGTLLESNCISYSPNFGRSGGMRLQKTISCVIWPQSGHLLTSPERRKDFLENKYLDPATPPPVTPRPPPGLPGLRPGGPPATPRDYLRHVRTFVLHNRADTFFCLATSPATPRPPAGHPPGFLRIRGGGISPLL